MKRWLIILPLSALGAALGLHFLKSAPAHASRLPTAGTPTIAQWFDDAPAAISFTFDDGLQSHADIAAPMFHQFGLKATFFVVPGLARQHPSDPKITPARLHFGEGALSWDEIRHIHDLGMEIGNHSLYHNFLNTITDDADLNHQINDAADLITQNVGQPPHSFAFPYNEWSPHARQVALQKHLAIRENWTDYGGPTFTTSFANHLVQNAIQTHAWLVPMIHGIDGGFLPLSSSVLHDHLAFIKAHLDQLWVDTYADVARYKLERTSASLHIQDSAPGEVTLTVTGKSPQFPVPLTVVLPLPLNENSDDVTARIAADNRPLPVTRQPGRVLVNLPIGSEIIVTWH